MTIKSNSIYGALVKTLVLILVLFFVSTPVFYLMISANDISENLIAYAYVITRVLRFVVVVVIGCVIRKKNRMLLTQNVLLRKKIFKLILGLVCVSILLHFNGITSDVYISMSYWFGIYDLGTTPLFLSVLWEQLFLGDLYWSILVGVSIVLFYMPATRKAEMHENNV